MGKIWRQILFVLLLVLVLAPFSRALATEDNGVVFNEIAWAGSSVSTADEWIELYNDSAEVVDLSDWKIQNLVTGKVMVTIQSGQIASFGYFLIANNSKDHNFSAGESVLNIDPDLIDSDVSLSNSEFKLGLVDNNSTLMDMVGDEGRPFFGGAQNGVYYSMSRVRPIESGEAVSSWERSIDTANLDSTQFDIASPESSGAPQIVYAKTADKRYQLGENLGFSLDFKVLDSRDDLDKIEIDLLNGASIVLHLESNSEDNYFESLPLYFCPKIKIIFIDKTGLTTMAEDSFICAPQTLNVGFSEVLPHPKNLDFNQDGKLDTNDEWFEITNFDDKNVSLDGFSVEAPNEPPFVIRDVNLGFGESVVFYNSQTGISLSDSKDSLVLKNPFGEIVSNVEIPSSTTKHNISYCKWGSKWQWSLKNTPGGINEIVTLPFSISGVVTEIDRSTFTIDTSSGSVQVSSGFAQKPNLGDEFFGKGKLTVDNNIYFPDDFKFTSQVQGGEDDLVARGNTGSVKVVKWTTKKVKYPSQKFKHINLQNLNADFRSSKISPFMVYLFSLFTVFSVIFIYEICCRE